MALGFLISLFLTALTAAQAFAYPPLSSINTTSEAEADAIKLCNAPGALQDTVTCWINDPDGNWFTGSDVLDIQTTLQSADWDKFVDTAFRTENNITKAMDGLLKPAGGLSGAVLGFALKADDALYGDQPVTVRGRMCGGLQALIGCAGANAARCQTAFNIRINRIPEKLGSTDFSLPPTANMQSVLELAAKILCYACGEADGREGLKILLAAALDGTKRKQIQDLMKPTSRLDIYRQCAFANKLPADQAPATKEEFTDLLKNQPCNYAPYFHCLTDNIDDAVNPGATFAAFAGVGNITFDHFYQCGNITVPGYGSCPQVAQIKSNFSNIKLTGRSTGGDGVKNVNGAAIVTGVGAVSFFGAIFTSVLLQLLRL